MKLGSAAIGIVIAGALGYLLEPSFRPALVPSAKKEGDKQAEKGGAGVVTPPAPGSNPAAPAISAAPAWVASLTPEQLPPSVTLKGEARLPIPGSAQPMVLPAGMKVKPVRVEGKHLIISFSGTMEGKLPVMETDLVQQLGNKPPAAAPAVATLPPEAPGAPAMGNPATPVAAAPPAAATPAAAATPPATPPVTPPAAAKELSPEEIVTVMQTSVKSGEIKEFTFEQVLGWKAAEDKESGGETYQSGLASYKAETIFGVKNIQAQALIKDGKVAKWIWPKSGMEIK
ncbi:hypothetical protein [Haloferula sp.]|uniref:hypothetical protein n=1 Tax=Haloferula sp. TaxID=2497595 RepID=UPI00329A802C